MEVEVSAGAAARRSHRDPQKTWPAATRPGRAQAVDPGGRYGLDVGGAEEAELQKVPCRAAADAVTHDVERIAVLVASAVAPERRGGARVRAGQARGVVLTQVVAEFVARGPHTDVAVQP